MRLNVTVCDLCMTGKGIAVLATHRYHQGDDPVYGEAFDICEPCAKTVESAGFHPYRVENKDNDLFREEIE